MKLAELRTHIQCDPENAWAHKRGWQPVYVAHEAAQILIVGQAPGRLAQENGIPFNDPSGDNLRAWLGIDRGTFYDPTKIALVPMDFYYPGTHENASGIRYDNPPRKGFAQKWHPLIRANLPRIKLTLLIGQFAQAYYLSDKRKKTLTETVRAYREYLPHMIPLVHPSPRNNIWHKKNPWFREEVVPVLQERVGTILDC